MRRPIRWRATRQPRSRRSRPRHRPRASPPKKRKPKRMRRPDRATPRPGTEAMRIRAISLDLDDTLWPIEPVMLRAEERLDAWLRQHCPDAAKHYPILAMRALRERISTEHPHLSHD